MDFKIKVHRKSIKTFVISLNWELLLVPYYYTVEKEIMKYKVMGWLFLAFTYVKDNPKKREGVERKINKANARKKLYGKK